MAVSKTQNERPAILALIDLANQLEGESNTHARNIATLTEGLADEVSDREAADTLLEEAIRDEAEARAQAVQGVQNQIGDGFTQTSVTTSLSATNQQVLLLGNEQEGLSETVSGILARLANLKFGATEEITVQANYSYSGSYDYPEPFGASSKSFVLLGFVDATLQTTLSLILIESTYSGFRYSINNTGTDPATVTVGYLAIAVG